MSEMIFVTIIPYPQRCQLETVWMLHFLKMVYGMSIGVSTAPDVPTSKAGMQGFVHRTFRDSINLH